MSSITGLVQQLAKKDGGGLGAAHKQSTATMKLKLIASTMCAKNCSLMMQSSKTCTAFIADHRIDKVFICKQCSRNRTYKMNHSNLKRQYSQTKNRQQQSSLESPPRCSSTLIFLPLSYFPLRHPLPNVTKYHRLQVYPTKNIIRPLLTPYKQRNNKIK